MNELYIKFWLPLVVIVTGTLLLVFGFIDSAQWTLLASGAIGFPTVLQGFQGRELRILQTVAMEKGHTPPVPLMPRD